MRRFLFASFLAPVMLLAVAGCGGPNLSPTGKNASTADPAQAPDTPEQILEKRLGKLRTDDAGKICSACEQLKTTPEFADKIIPELEKLANHSEADIAKCAADALAALKGAGGAAQ
jgi:predicted small lipoprotein YifL